MLVVAGLFLVVLLAVSGAYGFHPDETYYVVAGQHPAFGYVDQGPVTPLLSALSVALLGVSPAAVRVLPAIEMALVVVLVALIGARPRRVAAGAGARRGHRRPLRLPRRGALDSTSEPDLLAWAVILWLVVRLLAGGDRRLWLAVGVVAGIGLENKDTLLFLGAGLAVGLVLARRWDVVRSPWAWAAVGIALLLWAPNLAWQAANGWPQLTMAAGISGYAADNRAQVVPFLWLFAGLLLFPVSIAGWAWMLLARAASPWRAIGIAAVVILAARARQRRQGLLRIGIIAPLHGRRRDPRRPLAGPRPRAAEGGGLRRRRGALGRAHRLPDPAGPARRRRSRSPRSPPWTRSWPSRSAGRSSSRPSRGWSRDCRRTSAPAR